MSYTQTRDANWKVPYIGGWCEGFVEGAWGQASLPKQDSKGNWYTTGVYGSAIDKWNVNPGNGNHPGELPPSGVTVPVYFSLGNEADGHTAISLDDGSVASSTQPGTHPQGFIHPNLQNLINIYAKYNGGCTYLGWSEYVGTMRVVQPVNQPSQGGDTDMITNAGLNAIYWAYLGREPDQSARDHYVGNYTVDFVADDILASDERKQFTANHAIAAGRQTQAAADLAAVKTQLAAEQSKSVGLVKNVTDLTSQLATANQDIQQAESIAGDDATKINDLTAQLAAARANIDQLKAADKPEPTKPTGTVVPSTTPQTNPPLTPQQTPTWLTEVVAWLVSMLRK